MERKLKKFSRYAWFVVFYNVFVILWGTVVRATGSGAGCGNHWPKCNGEIIPRPEAVETVIEFSHRISSALSGVFVLLLVIGAFYYFTKKSAVRKWAVISGVFLLLEAWIGMLLVRRDLVAYNMSVERAWVVAWHLINTFLLVGSLVVTAWYADNKSQRMSIKLNRVALLLGVGLILILLFNAAGAVTALGDTLFPADSLREGLRQDMDPASNFLIQLRVIHPLLAILTSYYIYRVGGYIRSQFESGRLHQWVSKLNWIILIQIMVGFINLFLLAPIVMQVMHLLLAQIFWIVYVLVNVNVFSLMQNEA